jgi:1-deoxy-D-xylulose-5-phosphate synthase
MLALRRAAAAHNGGPFSVRYPRDSAPDSVIPPIADIPPTPYGTWEVLRHGSEVAILAVGTMVGPSLAAADALADEGLSVTVVDCRFLKPYDEVTLAAVLAEHRHVLTVEEATVVNGFGAFISSVIERHDPAVRVAVHGVPDRVIYAAPRKSQLARCGLDAAGIANRVRALRESEAMAG